MYKKTILILLFFSFLVTPISSFAILEREPPSEIDIRIPSVKPPQTIQEAEGWGVAFLNLLPGHMEKAWYEIVDLWTNLYHKAKSLWERHIKSRLISLWNSIWRRSQREIEEKKDILVEEIEKEKEAAKEAVKEEAKRASKSLWQRILESLNLR